MVKGKILNTKIQLMVGQKSRAGVSIDSDERGENSDAFINIQNFSGIQNQQLLGVFDGHGPGGAKISHSVK